MQDHAGRDAGLGEQQRHEESDAASELGVTERCELQVDDDRVDPCLAHSLVEADGVRQRVELPAHDRFGSLDLHRGALVGLISEHDHAVELVVLSHVGDQMEAELVQAVAAGRERRNDADAARGLKRRFHLTPVDPQKEDVIHHSSI